MSKKWKQVGSIREGKRCSECNTPLIENSEGKQCPKCKNTKGKLYIKIDDISTLEDGVTLQIEKPQDKIEKLNKLGHIKDEDVERRLESIPEWLKYEITQPPTD